MGKWRVLVKKIRRFVLAAGLIVALLVPAVASAQLSSGTQPIKSYIVQFEPGWSVDQTFLQTLSKQGISVRQTYKHVFQGFTAQMTPEQARALEKDARVKVLIEDFKVYASAQTVPTGVEVVGTLESTAANIDGAGPNLDLDIAVLDTGVSAHPDLNIAGGVNCLGGSSYADDNGHGTHVAGTIGAIDNDQGVVGVAPGARIWSVKVLDSSGSGSWSNVICGIDWVTANAETIEVANMSLGGGTGLADENNCGNGNGDLLHQAVCRSVSAGVVYTVAAGNNGASTSGYVPARYGEVITVSALAPSTMTLASFSNYGQHVDVIAPGVGVLSTVRGGGYESWNGTSMATPHVAGAAGLYLLTNPSATPAQVRSALIQTGSTSVWSGDRDSSKEPLINVSTFDTGSGGTPPPVGESHDAEVVSVSVPASVTVGQPITVTATVKNNGTVSDTLTVSASETPNNASATTQVTLGAGQSQAVNLSLSTVNATAGVHVVTVTAMVAGDANAGNNSKTANVTLQAPVVGGMYVNGLSLSSRTYRGKTTLTATVNIRDNGKAVRSAKVTLKISYPNGSSVNRTVTTGSTGSGSTSLTVTAKGTYTVSVVSVTKTGSTYNPALNRVNSASRTI
jgi:hypothetical protein